ncbi:hypothetical protein [Amycolatopsis sp. NPDC051371]
MTSDPERPKRAEPDGLRHGSPDDEQLLYTPAQAAERMSLKKMLI